jgi:hypothetical protein
MRELLKHGIWNDEPMKTGNKEVDEALNEMRSFFSILNDYAVQHGLMVKPIPLPLFENMGGDKGLEPISHLLAVGKSDQLSSFRSPSLCPKFSA